MWKQFLTLVAALLIASGLTGVRAETQPFLVVVNADNILTEISAEDLSKIFLGKTDEWDDGTAVEPVDLVADAPARSAFTKLVHGRSVSEVKTFWQRQIFSGRDVPPYEADSEEEVLKFVGSSTGSVGYVSAEAELPAGIKVLTIIG